MVERFFGKITTEAIRRGSFASVRELELAIEPELRDGKRGRNAQPSEALRFDAKQARFRLAQNDPPSKLAPGSAAQSLKWTKRPRS